MATLLTMTDSTGYFIGDYIGEQVDVGVGTSIGFNTTFYTPLTNVIAGMIVGDRSYYAPYVEDGKVKAMDFMHPWEAQGKPRVVPTHDESISWKAYLGTYGFTFLPGGFDPGILDSMYICLEGNGSCYEKAGGNFAPTEVKFSDPWSKKTYIAYTTNYDNNRIDAAFSLLTKANNFLALYEEHEWGGSPETDAIKAKYEKKLHQTVEVIDLVYTLGELFGHLNY